MKSKKTLVITIVVLVVLIAGASILYKYLGDEYQSNQLVTQETTNANKENSHEENANNSGDTTNNENPAPDFTVVDIEGNEHKLSDFEGKPVVLNFWASWCGPCKSEMPDFNEAYGKYKDDVHFLMVNLTDGSRETVEVASNFIKDAGYFFPVYYDTKIEAATAYSVYSIPATYFIDAEGNLVARANGAISGENLQAGIDMIR